MTAICLSQLKGWKGWNFVSLSQSPTWTLALNPTQPINRSSHHIVWIALYFGAYHEKVPGVAVVHISNVSFNSFVGGGENFPIKSCNCHVAIKVSHALHQKTCQKLPSKQTPRNLFKSILSELRISWNSASLKIKAQISLRWTQNKGEIQFWKLPRPLKFCMLLKFYFAFMLWEWLYVSNERFSCEEI